MAKRSLWDKKTINFVDWFLVGVDRVESQFLWLCLVGCCGDWLLVVVDRVGSQFLWLCLVGCCWGQVYSQFLCLQPVFVCDWLVAVFDMVHSQFLCVTGLLLFLTGWTVSTPVRAKSVQPS